MELWKSISGVYEISNMGRVKSTKKQKVLKTYISNNTEYIKLDLGNGRRSYSIHRLVAKSFIPTQDGKHYVNHIDGNPLNNLLENLEWCTQKENIFHSKNITKNGAVVSVKKIKEFYKISDGMSLENFVVKLISLAN
jgi:hypothetical protein